MLWYQRIREISKRHVRLEQLSRNTSGEKHPFQKFATGSYKCLREEPVLWGVDIWKRFIEFHTAHYSANRMKLVFLGRESPQESESWTLELFSDVPNKKLHRLRWDTIQVLEEPELMTQIFVKPVMEQRQWISRRTLCLSTQSISGTSDWPWGPR